MTATATQSAGPEDRVLPATRWASWAIAAILVPAVVALWGLPGRTADLWAWTIKPDMTAIFMGAGYAAGTYFFIRLALGRRWTPGAAGVLASAVFAALMLLPTFLHYDRFNHGDAPFLAAFAFYGWVAVYIVSPFAVGALWWLNRRAGAVRAASGEAVVPLIARRAAAAIGAAALVAAAVFLVSPGTAQDVWPWMLAPLTARVLACFTAQVGLGLLLLSFDARWRAWRLLMETFLIASGLLLIGAARAWGDFDQDRVSTWLFLGGLLGLSAAILLLYRNATVRARRPAG